MGELKRVWEGFGAFGSIWEHLEKLRRIKESLISSGEFSGEFEKLGGSSEDFGRV